MKRRMIPVRLFAPIAILLVVGAAPGWARADETPAPARWNNTNEAPPTAFAALVRAAAAYEYGDMAQVVDAARPVAEGTLPSSAEQRARALRFLGIGLFLTNRALGADNAFAELLRVDPSARLDPTTTRPEVVAFFENIRHQHVARERAASRHFIWNLLPPVGQFRNGDTTKGWLVGGVEVIALGTCVASRLVSYSWHHADNTYGPNGTRASDERTLRVVEWTSAGVLAAAYLYGVIDGIVHYYRPPDDSSSSLTLLIFPGGGGLRLTF
jgi:hypothetical protein